ncbi:IMS domain-containing protein [Lusitaniella coriacea]|uniref:IMS domain-containing protein n=1 Tax=Lusitaniella coriacea TaxID=1983105 RepID=UPI003CF48D0B
MRIPLDYYRILGVPIQATDQQRDRAYQDRALQLPRREYSDAAISARKQLLDEAYSVLSDPEQRAEYDSNFLSKTTAKGGQSSEERLKAKPDGAEIADASAPTSWLEIDDDKLVGALLILLELGEYELVLKLGQPFLETRKDKNLGRKDEEDTKLIRADIILTLALACLELGREQWQQGQSENAALSGQMGQDLLLREGLFPNLRGEIQSDLYRLRPYRILELLALNETESLKRRQGLQILRDMLDERKGIDGSGDDGSGLGVDDCLRFIQQIRNYLTVAEQQELFEGEASRPSAVGSYLAVYALIARGFAQRQPALVVRARQLLSRLCKRQDVYLEQAVCALLLGQTEEASRALEQSQEYEPLAFIREHSQNSPDLLPGLCLYGEQWLQAEVFPHFRDLATQRAALKDYFADEQVQAYLEQLPVEEMQQSPVAAATPQNLSVEPSVQDLWGQTPQLNYATAASGGEGGRHNGRTATVERSASAIAQGSALRHAIPSELTASPSVSEPKDLPPATRDLDEKTLEELPKNGDAPEGRRNRRRRERNLVASGDSNNGHSGEKIAPARDRRKSLSSTQVWRLLLLLSTGFILLAASVLLVRGTVGWIQNASKQSKASKLQEGQPAIELAKPIVEIPASDARIVVPDGPLTQESAKQIVSEWLAVKSKAFGPQHEIDSLKTILAEPTLSTWLNRARKLKTSNHYREYEHAVQVEALNPEDGDGNEVSVDAAVNEAAKVYQNGQLNLAASYDDKLSVRYDLVRQDGQWLIKKMQLK